MSQSDSPDGVTKVKKAVDIYIYMHIYICILYINTQVIPTKEVALKMMKKSFHKCIELSAIQIPVHYSTIPLIL